jgi:hypothetical protein
MAGYGDRPYGLRQVALYSSDGSGKILLPAAMMLHVSPKAVAETFSAEGRNVGAAAFLSGAEWELEAGGLSLEAYAKLTGLSAAASGTTPNRTLTLSLEAGNIFPYIRIYGRAVADAGDVYCRLYRCKLTALEGTFRGKEFWISYASGVAVSNGTLVLDFVQHETAVAL